MGATMSRAPESARWVRNIGPAPSDYRPADRPGLPPAWWRSNPRYTLYMLREFSSVTNAVWSVVLLLQLDRLRRGEEGYEAFVAAQRRPGWMAFHLVTLLFAAIHSVTFLLAAGKGPVLRLRGRLLPERTVAAGAFAGWAAASSVVLLVLLFGGRDKER